ncbi:tRNA-dihydrouridine(20) synthase [NAD(P)+]-like isoform X3 [Selaginella moellendorffii]|nr:tRNA-dihydrouridine(20) synthase [NAD(P)+]-like isoform X3 [Selaginella moellendorffii]|eukprot:XP_024520344.1 tRNA-dihydrouridine(20) synthase [NAD(P)+]-like isoform X3 [Selaginella moellendorffii]
MAMAHGIDYRDKLILAPMVRVAGNAAVSDARRWLWRRSHLRRGDSGSQDAQMLSRRERYVRLRPSISCVTSLLVPDVLGSIDFVENGTNDVVFRTCKAERDHVVFQMGTSDPYRALTVAQLLCRDIAAVDINMGCPKPFSVTGGMGSALLSQPELVSEILTTLRRNLDIPVTCKIRLLKSTQETVELARRIEKTGVSAIAVHGRRIPDRPKDRAKWDGIADVVSALSIPVIANGDVFEPPDIPRIKAATGASSVMVARGALWNASIFRPEGKLDWEEVKREYLRQCIVWENDIKFTKYTVNNMIIRNSSLESPEGRAVHKCQSLLHLA